MRRLAVKLFAVIFSASVASADDVRHQVAIVDSPAADYIAICGWEFDVEGGGYSTCTIDLDGDGLEDHMFANAGTSGTGGQAATLYLARKDRKFTRIGSLGHGAISSETIKTGGTLLHCSWSFGGGATSITTYLISHDGLKQVMAYRLSEVLGNGCHPPPRDAFGRLHPLGHRRGATRGLIGKAAQRRTNLLEGLQKTIANQKYKVGKKN